MEKDGLGDGGIHSDKDFSSMTVPELRAWCKRYGLVCSGKKADLVDRANTLSLQQRQSQSSRARQGAPEDIHVHMF